MTTFIFSADVSSNAINTPVKIIAASDTIFVSAGTTLSALGAGSSTIVGANDNQFDISGNLFSVADAIATSGGSNNVIIASTSSITAFGNAIDLGAGTASGSNQITVSGSIIAEFVDLNLAGNSNSISIYGSVTSQDDVCIQLIGSGNIIFNSGTIDGLYDGQAINCGGGGNQAINTGTISGEVFFGGNFGDANTFVNKGTMIGAGDIYPAFGGGGADDTVTNSGFISGGVDLGNGNNLYDGRLGVTIGTIKAGSGNDTLLGGAGDEIFVGGGGADEISGGGGFDSVKFNTAVVASLADQNVNTGEALGDVYTGIEGLIGSFRSDVLIGDGNNNKIDDGGSGGGDPDTMIGGAGNDIYFVNNSHDNVVESPGQGIDRVNASVSFVLAANVEALHLTGNVNISGTGNALANTIVGNGQQNLLDGKAGNDVLAGGPEKDTFVFDTALNATTNVDRIVDFTVGQDKISLAHVVFTGLPAGPLSPGAFHIGAAAADGDDRIIYNPTTGALLFDHDGTGPAAAIKFAQLPPGLAPTAGDFLIT